MSKDYPSGVNTDYIKTYPCKGEPEPGECIECTKRKEDKPMANQPNIDDVLCGLCHWATCEMCIDHQQEMCDKLCQTKQKLGEIIEGCLYYTVNNKKDFIGISASIKNLTKLGLLPERS